jgi:hypothetical protein
MRRKPKALAAGLPRHRSYLMGGPADGTTMLLPDNAKVIFHIKGSRSIAAAVYRADGQTTDGRRRYRYCPNA